MLVQTQPDPTRSQHPVCLHRGPRHTQTLQLPRGLARLHLCPPSSSKPGNGENFKLLKNFFLTCHWPFYLTWHFFPNKQQNNTIESAIRASIGLSIKNWRHKSKWEISLPFCLLPFSSSPSFFRGKDNSHRAHISTLLQTTEIAIVKIQLFSNEW